MKRPPLNLIPLEDVRIGPGVIIITMSWNQWDKLLEEAYSRGHTLLELNDNEVPIGAYRKEKPA